MDTVPPPGARVAIAVIRSDPPQVLVADSEQTLGRLVALHVVAQSDPGILSAAGVLEGVRNALLTEQWGDAVAGWMEASGEIVDAYPDEVLWSADMIEAERTSLEIRLAPVFSDPA